MSPIFVAIDTQDVHRAAAIARDVSGIAAGVKLGLEFFCANGHEGVLRIAEHETPVFLDLKLHDIPNTVEKAVHALARLEPAILTVHAAGGGAMMAAAKSAAPPGTRVVAVTVLTSLDPEDLAAVGVRDRPPIRSLGSRRSRANPDWTESSVRGPKWRWRGRRGPRAFSWCRGCGRPERTSETRRGSSRPRRPSPTALRCWSSGGPITSASDPRRAIMDIAASLEQTPAEART